MKNQINKKILFVLVVIFSFAVILEIKYLYLSGDYISINDISILKQQISDLELSIQNDKNQLKLVSDKMSNINKNLSEEAFLVESNRIKEEIELYKKYIGYTDVFGEGIILIVEDSYKNIENNDEILDLIVHDIDIRIFVDALKDAGAEAISVNDIRIVNGLSKIYCNGPIIKINDVEQSPPYIIKAIGDKYKLSNAIINPKSKIVFGDISVQLYTNKFIKINGNYISKFFNYAKVLE